VVDDRGGLARGGDDPAARRRHAAEAAKARVASNPAVVAAAAAAAPAFAEDDDAEFRDAEREAPSMVAADGRVVTLDVGGDVSARELMAVLAEVLGTTEGELSCLRVRA